MLGVGSSGARLDPDTESLVTRRGSQEASSYRVDSRPAHGDPSAPPLMARRALARYLELPADFPPAVKKLARRLTASAASPQERAYALQDNMRLLYDYDTSVPPGHSHDALARFLFERRAGYCEQFAGTYAAMARSVGLPARVAVGFTPGSYEVDSDRGMPVPHAHAWPEVYLDGAGWVAFEPTPGRVPTIESGGRNGGSGPGRPRPGRRPGAVGPAAGPRRPRRGRGRRAGRASRQAPVRLVVAGRVRGRSGGGPVPGGKAAGAPGPAFGAPGGPRRLAGGTRPLGRDGAAARPGGDAAGVRRPRRGHPPPEWRVP